MVANRVALELASLRPRPPAMRVFDAGIGDGTVLARVMRAMHARFPTMPFYLVGKEISLEDIRLTLEKLPDRFFEHPATVVVLTNMFYSEAPWLRVHSPAMAASLVWREVPLAGNAAHEFDRQIGALLPFLAENWQTRMSPRTGNPIYERPVVLVLYRDDHRFLLDGIIPRLGEAAADYDLVIASQPYRLRIPAEFKAKRVIAPLASALGPGGRLIAIHSYGHDPCLDVVQKLWPDEEPFVSDRHEILTAVKDELGSARRDLNFNAYSDARSIFRYDMHTLSERGERADRHLDAVRGLERGDLRRADRRRAAPGSREERALSRGYGRGAPRAWRTMVPRRVLRHLAAATMTPAGEGGAIAASEAGGTASSSSSFAAPRSKSPPAARMPSKPCVGHSRRGARSS